MRMIKPCAVAITAASLAVGTREHMVWTVKVLFFINHYTGKCVEKLFMAVEIPWVPFFIMHRIIHFDSIDVWC